MLLLLNCPLSPLFPCFVLLTRIPKLRTVQRGIVHFLVVATPAKAYAGDLVIQDLNHLYGVDAVNAV